LAQAIGAVLGWGVLLLAVGAVCVATLRRARRLGLMAPLLVGFGLRLVVMLIAHVASLSLGDHGLLVVDDQTYLNGGTLVSELWRGGHTSGITQPDVLGTYQFGYQLFLATLFTLATPSVLLGKLMNVLMGAITIVLVGMLGERLLGERARLRAAWIAALAPNLVWWSAPLLKEAIATMLMVLGLLAITYLPRPRALALLGGVLAVFLFLRGPAALALVAGALLAVAVAGRRIERRWLSRPLVFSAGLIAGGAVVVVAVVSRGNLSGLYHQYQFVVHNMIHEYQGGNPARIPYDAIKSLVTPIPWVFDRNTENWDRALFPGVWLLMCALPLAALGAWRLRRRPEAWALLGTAATALTINSFTSGFVFRQRSMLEPIVLLLALAGARSWRMAARCAAATLVVVAAGAGVQSRSPLVVAAIAAGAAALALASRRLPGESFEPLPESPMLASFRRRLEARAAGQVLPLKDSARAAALAARATLARRAPTIAWHPETVAAGAPGRATLLRAAPSLDLVAPAPAAHGTAPSWLRPALVPLVQRFEHARGDQRVRARSAFRWRPLLRPIELLLALAGVRSWQMAARWGAVAVLVVAAIAGVESGSLLVAAAVVATAAALAFEAGHLPAVAFEPSPESARAPARAARAKLARRAPSLDPGRGIVLTPTARATGRRRLRYVLAPLVHRFERARGGEPALAVLVGRARRFAMAAAPPIAPLEAPDARLERWRIRVERLRLRTRGGTTRPDAND
jgi:hypothetical protein